MHWFKRSPASSRSRSGALQGGVQGQLLHLGLRHLPTLFPEGVVFAGVVKMAAQRSLALFISGSGAVADDGGRPARPEGLTAQLGVFHKMNGPPLEAFGLVCAKGEKI